MSGVGTFGPRSDAGRRLLGILVLALAGQLLLLLLGSLTPELVRFVGVGPKIAPDSVAYLDAAADLPSVDPEWWGKILYILLLRIGQMVGSGEWFIVGLQFFAVSGAGLALLDVGRRSGSLRSGWVAAAIWLLNPQTAQWTSAVLTDSAFMSLTLLVLWSATRALAGSGRWASALLPALTIALLRPNGLLTIAAVSVLWIWSSDRSRSMVRDRLPARIASTVVVMATVVLVVGLSPAHRSGTGGADDRPLQRLVAGEVIWGETAWSRPMPPPPDTDRSLGALVRYAASEPVPTIDIGLRRMLIEVIQVRPHYPVPVNIVVGATMLLYLGAALLGASSPAGGALRRPVLVLTLPMLGAIGATWASPEGRFGWAFLVLLLPWVGLGVDRVLRRLRPARRARRPARR